MHKNRILEPLDRSSKCLLNLSREDAEPSSTDPFSELDWRTGKGPTERVMLVPSGPCHFAWYFFVTPVTRADYLYRHPQYWLRNIKCYCSRQDSFGNTDWETKLDMEDKTLGWACFDVKSHTKGKSFVEIYHQNQLRQNSGTLFSHLLWDTCLQRGSQKVR